MDTYDEALSLACDMAALSPAQRERRAELVRALAADGLAVAEVPAGYALQLPADAGHILAAAEFVSLERLCCPFLTLALELPPRGSLTLRLAGPAGARKFIRAELAELFGAGGWGGGPFRS